MAAPSFTTDLQDWILDSDTAAWGELSGMIAGGSPDEADTESALQGTNTTSQATNTTSLFSMCRILASSKTLNTGDVFLVWHGHGVATALLSYANGGLRIYVANTLSDYKGWAVGGNDVPPFPYGKWVNNAVDPTLTGEYTNGTAPTGLSFFGVGSAGQLSQAVAKGQPHVVDIIRYGRAEARFTGGDSTNGYATFAGFAAVNDTSANRWGLLQTADGGFLWKGLMNIGYGGTACEFTDTNKSIFIQDTRKVYSSFNKIEIRTTGTVVDWTGVSFTCVSPSTTASKGQFEVVTDVTVGITNCTFVDMDTFIFQSNSTVDTTTFRRCGQVTVGGGTFTGCVFDRSTAASATTMTNLSYISDCEFKSSGTGHAITLTSLGSGTMVWNNNDTGYATTDGTTGNETIYVNVGTGSLTINVTAGYSTPTIRTAGATVTVVSGQVTTTITVKDVSTGSLIGGARVYLYADGTTGPLSAGTVIFNELTDSTTGQVSDTRALASDQPVAGWVRKGSSSPLYQTAPISASIDSGTGLALTVQMIPDE